MLEKRRHSIAAPMWFRYELRDGGRCCTSRRMTHCRPRCATAVAGGRADFTGSGGLALPPHDGLDPGELERFDRRPIPARPDPPVAAEGLSRHRRSILESATIRQKEINQCRSASSAFPPARSGRLAPVESPLCAAVLLAPADSRLRAGEHSPSHARPRSPRLARSPRLMLPAPAALLVVAAAWIVNQAIGFGALGYPVDADTMLWGLAIGTRGLDRNRDVGTGIAFPAANRRFRGDGFGPDCGLRIL